MFIETIVLLALVSMARKGRGRGRYRRYLRGEVNQTMTLTTLAGRTIAVEVEDETVEESTWLSSVKLTWALSELTPGTDDGPVAVGIAHSDYSSTEIEEWIENTGSWKEGDLVQSREVGKRLIRQVGIFAEPATALAPVTLNDGKPIRTKCGWLLTSGDTIQFWAYNLGTSAFATTAPLVAILGHANLWPR